MERQISTLRLLKIESVRIPANLRELLRAYVQMDAHLNESDLIRDTIRDKIKNDAPELYGKFFKRLTSEAKSVHSHKQT